MCSLCTPKMGYKLPVPPQINPVQISAQQHPAFIAIYDFLCNKIPLLNLFPTRDYIPIPRAQRLARVLGDVGRRDNGPFLTSGFGFWREGRQYWNENAHFPQVFLSEGEATFYSPSQTATFRTQH